jgi:SSS family solute:Na+ symporter
MFIKVALIIAFFGMLITVGIISRKKASSVNNFVLGGRSIGPWMSAFSYGASYFSAVIFVGYAGQFGYKFGMAATWIGIGNALIGALLAWSVLGRRTRVMSNHLDSRTMPDFFGKRFDSRTIKLVASAIVFIFLVPYTSSVYNGLSRLFEMAFGIPYYYCVIGMALLTAIYVVLGGYMAAAANDLLQGGIMLFGIVLVIGTVLSDNGGFLSALTQLSQIESDVALTAGQQGAFISFFGPDPVSLLSVIVLTSLGAWAMPQMVHKYYAIKDERSIFPGAIISTIFAVIVGGGSYFLGGFSRLYDSPAIYDAAGNVVYDSIIPTMLSNMPDIIIGVVIMLVLAASISTLASLVLTSSSTLTLDFIKGTVVKDLSEKRQMLCLRGLIVVFIIVSVAFALNPPTFIAQLMGISWGALAGSFLGPYIFGLYWKRTTKAAVAASFAFGVGFTVANLIFGFMSSPITAGAVAMLASLIIVPLVSLITPRMNKSHTEQVFLCYGKPEEGK